MKKKKKEICGNWIMTGDCHKDCDFEYHPNVMALKNNEEEFKNYVEKNGNANYNQFLIKNNIPRELCYYEKCRRKSCKKAS